MRRMLPLLLLAGCNGPVAPAPTETPASVPTAPAEATPTPAPTPTDDHTMPTIADLKTFRDWTVGCDNGGTCKAAALAPAMAGSVGPLMTVERPAGPDGRPIIRIQSNNPLALPLTVLVDGREVARGGVAGDDLILIDGDAGSRIAAALPNGRRLTLRDAAGVEGTVSLAGASAALRLMDENQRRDGTEGALVATGTRPDTAEPSRLPIVRPAEPGDAVAALTPALIEAMRGQVECDERELPEPQAYPLQEGQTLVLLPCISGAYNLISPVFVVADGRATPARFDAPSGMDPDQGVAGARRGGVQNVVNGTFERGSLSSYAKGRGLGDCGVEQRFVWDGTRFRLIHQAQMGECRGNIDYITTWRANVVR